MTDRNIQKAGIAEKISSILSNYKFNITTYDRISAEPTIEIMREAVEFTREGNYNLIIGLGGGSCLDTAKMMAAGATNPGDISDYVYPSQKNFSETSLPMIMIPTTSGTGSEVTGAAVVINKGYKSFAAGINMTPQVAIVDPELVVTCPPRQTAACGMDALAQVIEPLLSKENNPLRDALALHATSLISRSLREAYSNGENVQARWDMAISTTLSGIVMTNSACGWPGHTFAEVFGPMYNIHHGAACALALPYVTKFTLPACAERTPIIASALGIKTRSNSPGEVAEQIVTTLVELARDLNVPLSLKDLGVPKAALTKISVDVNRRMNELTNTAKLNSRPISNEDVENLLGYMWDGSWLPDPTVP